MLRAWRRRITLTDIVVWAIGASILVGVVWGSIVTLGTGKYSAANWIDLTIVGLALGGVYALIALGYTLVYGILRMINFAHSEVFMSGAFTAYFAADAMAKSGFLKSNTFIAILILFAIAMTTSILIGVLVERIAYRPLRRAPRLVPLITAID